ncbi:MAG: ABC transporter ATP-binding protein [Fervidobacterium sp.]|nr:ABC transporter ATP-binding protein [Fervidobacterium sp.]
MLKVKDVEKKFKNNKKILEGISAEFFPGQVAAIIGENGSGKSTLLNIVATFLRPTKGMIHFNEKDVFKNIREYRQIVSYISEKVALIPELSVEDNLRYFHKIFKSSAIISEISSRVGIQDFIKLKPSHLSKGQKQRVSIAVSLLKDPQIVLLDEPAEGLDVETKQVVKNLVKQYRNAGKIVLYVTHDEDEIEEVCDKILVLKFGKIAFFGTVEEFWERYEKFYTVTYKVNTEKKMKIMSLDELNENKNQLEIVHLRNLGLREIINIVENYERR